MAPVEPPALNPQPSSVSDRVLAALERSGKVRAIQRGTTVFERGEPGFTMYLIHTGEVELSFESGRRCKRLGPGEFFGELVLIRGDHGRSATAVAVTDCRLLELGGDAFEALQRAEPAALVELLRHSCRTLLGSEEELILTLRRRNEDLDRTLDFLRRMREELDSREVLAQTDELTGIYNRRCFRLQASKLTERAEAQGIGLAVIIIDVDDFKSVNDTLGHAVGDLVLQHLADALRQAVRWSDLPCRIGGDEFAVLLTDFPSATAGGDRARSLFHRTGRLTLAVSGHPLTVSTSQGGAAYCGQETFEELLARADRSLFLAKQSGRHRLAWEGEIIADGTSPTG